MLSKIAEESSDKAIQPVGPSSTSNVSIKNCHLKGWDYKDDPKL